MIGAYPNIYLNEVVENQGKLFDIVGNDYPQTDTKDFITAYMMSKTRKHIDEAKAYVNTMDAPDLLRYFTETENYTMKRGESVGGFMPDWIGEFYAFYQWYYNIPSAELIEKVPLDFLMRAY